VKWLITFIIVAAVAGLAVWYFVTHDDNEAQYQLAAVSRGDITQVVTATGQLNPVVNVQVGSQVSGRIIRIMADFNSQVKSNQPIAYIDPSTYQNALLRAEAELANAKANLALVQVQAKRAESLFTNNLISASDHDVALAQEQQAKAQLQSAEAAAENAKVDLSRCTIYAPVDGVVISRSVDVGQTVASSFNTPTLFSIANDLSQMQIDALVSEADIGGVATNQTAKFTVDAFPYRTFRGRVKQIRYGALTNQNVVTYDCVVEVNNSDLKLLPGMTASLSIVIGERTNVVRIPNAALRFRPPEAIAAETNTTRTASTSNAAPEVARNDAAGARSTDTARGAGPNRSGGAGPGTEGAGGQGPGAGQEGRRRGGGEGRGPGTGGAGGGGTRPKPERAGPRTVYTVVAGSGKEMKLKPITIRTGLNDGAYTEVIEGLKEGDQVVTGLLAANSGQPGGSRPSNPFSGGGFRRF